MKKPCKECNGTGDGDGKFNHCTVCNGYGSFDWLQEIFGHKGVYVKPGVYMAKEDSEFNVTVPTGGVTIIFPDGIRNEDGEVEFW